MTLNHGVAAPCAAQACAQIGAFCAAALLPTLIAAWSLSNTEAGWISGIMEVVRPGPPPESESA